MKVSVTVNGDRREAEIEPRRLLAHLLREDFGLTATNIGCDTTSCGACTVLVDGESVKSCTMLAASADGRAVTTMEGLADGEQWHPVQQAFREKHGLQCGFCTPGMVMAAVSLLRDNPKPTAEEVRDEQRGCSVRARGHRGRLRAGGLVLPVRRRQEA